MNQALVVSPAVTSHSITLVLGVSAKAYAYAARQLCNGNRNANPLELARITQNSYVLVDYTGERIALLDTKTGQKCWCYMPAVLVLYLAGFQAGRHVFEDHEFDLILDGEGQ